METDQLSPQDFLRVAELVNEISGMKMPPAKHLLIQSRLFKRMRHLGLPSYQAYCDYLFSPEGQAREVPHMVSEVTTNKTDFFRESPAFAFLLERELPDWVERRIGREQNPALVWSAGCATGEEPYSLAMMMDDFSKRVAPLHFSILASDISLKALDRAREAIYPHEKAQAIPLEYRKRYLLRKHEGGKELVRIVAGLREKVRFTQINLMEEYQLPRRADIVFCRNVLIYFDTANQGRILNGLIRQLKPGGLLVTGLTETIHDFPLPVEEVGKMVYRRLPDEQVA